MACEGPVTLRRATTADAAGIAQVHVDDWQRAHAGLVSEEYAQRHHLRPREESWREELEIEAPDRTPWVALVDHRIIGFAASGAVRDDDADLQTGEIYQLVVDPECWQRGIRTNLMEHVSRDLTEHDFDRAIMWVLAKDEGMRSFADYVGWEADGATRFEELGDTRVEQLRYSHQLR